MRRKKGGGRGNTNFRVCFSPSLTSCQKTNEELGVCVIHVVLEKMLENKRVVCCFVFVLQQTRASYFVCLVVSLDMNLRSLQSFCCNHNTWLLQASFFLFLFLGNIVQVNSRISRSKKIIQCTSVVLHLEKQLNGTSEWQIDSYN